MYIRTKDEIYVLSEAYWAGIKDEIIAESDNLAELCDCFFIESENPNHILPIVYKQFWRAKKEMPLMKAKVMLYGAISIKGKGLIYVAKMNEDGELVLI